jgi:hypothetical protein
MARNERLNLSPAELVERLRPDLDAIAGVLASEAQTRADLAQEMAGRLLQLPSGQTRPWYLRRVRDCAMKYKLRVLLDAPLDPHGRPILERQVRAVGGLRELDAFARNGARNRAA